MEEIQDAIAKCLRGDAAAFGPLVSRFQDFAVASAFARLRDFQLAEDAAQEAFMEAFRALAKLREPAGFGAWLHRIVLKHCDRQTRRRKPHGTPVAELLSDSTVHNPAHSLEALEMKELLQRAIEHLAEHEREAVVLYYIGEHSVAEIAEYLSVPESTVKNRLHTAREHLREWFEGRLCEQFSAARPSRNAEFQRRTMRLICEGRDPDGNRFVIAQA